MQKDEIIKKLLAEKKKNKEQYIELIKNEKKFESYSAGIKEWLKEYQDTMDYFNRMLKTARKL